MDKIVRELSALGIIREEPSPITNSPIQAVKKPESAGGANGFFSLRLAKQSQGKTAFTHKGKAYVWQRLPQGYKNSPNVFQSAVMDVLKDLGATIYIDDVFIADDTEEEHLEKLQKRRKKEDPEGQPQAQWTWTATDQENLEKLKKAIQEAGRLEPRSLTARLVAEISCEDDDAMVRVNNEGGGMGTKATNARWGRWEDILLDPDLELGPTLPTTKKQQTTEVTQEEPYEWVLYTDGSKKGLDNTAYWGYILKQNEKEKHRQKGRVPGSAQVGEVTAILEGLLELGKRKVKRARIITDSHYCAQALKEDLTIWEENGFEGAKGKAVAHQDLWKKIAELRLTMNLDVVHQKAHGKEGAHWRGNDEVDRYVQQRRIVFVGIEKWDKTPKGKVVPKESVEEVVQAVHEALGHAGTMPTRKELEKQQLWVPGDQVRHILRDCEVCGRYDAGRRGQRVEGLTIKSTVPWGSVCMDVAGPMGVTGKKGEKYLLVLVDSMSGMW
ncbi:hypothetical protein L3Q82_020370 [Scortum barcoo]|uniref:Uncharacterized protein n=1 Tax=Scortum barcoo TaxID=214431 RepID=A0ACB8V7D7_9TELE|nr:hypothetical protein L3Q82_020370 [Scortum barcoo]